jgi:cold shock CspA family protein
VRIDLAVPRDELVIGRNPPENPQHEDMHAAVDDAFDDAERVLEDYAQRLRGEVKQRVVPPQGRVTKLFPIEGYGFLEGDDGVEIYFHRHSVLHDRYDELTIGSEVRYTEEAGEKGPQASTVTVLGGRAHHR